MKTFYKVSELKQELSALERADIGFVPTMGALHAGHRSLVEKARKECKCVVVSVFVNPTQFNDKNDLRNYPRTPEADAAVLEAAGADYVLMPSVEEIYPEPDTRQFDFGQIDKVMEGATRPGHFNGVAQVVSRLFNIVEPAKAYFGEKDFQQIAVIKAMVKQLGMDVEIVECPIVRGEDGLALSSRNTLLDEAHRAAAPHIYEVISQCAEMSKQLSPAELTAWVTAEVEKNPCLKVIYFQAVDALSMQQVASWEESDRIQGCIAVQAGEITVFVQCRCKVSNPQIVCVRYGFLFIGFLLGGFRLISRHTVGIETVIILYLFVNDLIYVERRICHNIVKLFKGVVRIGIERVCLGNLSSHVIKKQVHLCKLYRVGFFFHAIATEIHHC